MGRKDRFISALDIGTTKTCAIIAEIKESGLRFLGHGCVESHGGRRGQIVNLDLASGSIRKAVEKAESEAGSPIESAVIGVAGSHIRGINSRGGISLGRRARDVRREDVRDAIQAARGVTLPNDRETLHVLPQEFVLDAQDGIRDPIGMVGQRLEADVHIVTSSTTAVQNVVTAVNKAGITVSDTVLEPLAAAEVCLTQDERELGCCLIDLGGGTTEVVVFTGGALRHTAAFPVGGDHFTNDLAVGLRTPMQEAERVKIEHASAWKGTMPEGTEIEVASVGGRPPRTVLSRMIGEIVQARAQELLSLIRDDMRRAGWEAQVPAGLVLTGGGARLRGFLEAAEQVFSLPARMAGPRPQETMPSDLAEPEFSTVVGLLLYGTKMRRTGREDGDGGKGWWGKIFGS